MFVGAHRHAEHELGADGVSLEALLCDHVAPLLDIAPAEDDPAGTPGRPELNCRLFPDPTGPSNHAERREAYAALVATRAHARALHPWLVTPGSGRLLRAMHRRLADTIALEKLARSSMINRRALAHVAGVGHHELAFEVTDVSGTVASAGFDLVIGDVRLAMGLRGAPDEPAPPPLATTRGWDVRAAEDLECLRRNLEVSVGAPERLDRYRGALRRLIDHGQSLLLRGRLDEAVAVVSAVERTVFSGAKRPHWFWRLGLHEALVVLAWATAWMSVGGPYLPETVDPSGRRKGPGAGLLSRARLVEQLTTRTQLYVGEHSNILASANSWLAAVASEEPSKSAPRASGGGGGPPTDRGSKGRDTRRVLPLIAWMGMAASASAPRLLTARPERPPATVAEAVLVLRAVHDALDNALSEGPKAGSWPVQDDWRTALDAARRTFDRHGVDMGVLLCDTTKLVFDLLTKPDAEVGIGAIIGATERTRNLHQALQLAAWYDIAVGLGQEPTDTVLFAEAARALLTWHDGHPDRWLRKGAPSLHSVDNVPPRQPHEAEEAPSLPRLVSDDDAPAPPGAGGHEVREDAPSDDRGSGVRLFINVPYDSDYEPWLDVLEVVAVGAGAEVRLAGDTPAGSNSEHQYENVSKALEMATHTLHDLVRANGEGPLSTIRANMSFEAGMSIVGERYHLVVTPAATDLDRVLSDINDNNVYKRWTHETYRSKAEFAHAVHQFLTGHALSKERCEKLLDRAECYATTLLVGNCPEPRDALPGRFRWAPAHRRDLIQRLLGETP